MPRFHKCFAPMAPESGEGGGGGGSGTPPPAPPSPPPNPEVFSREYVTELRNENKGTRLRASTLEAELATEKKAREEGEKKLREDHDNALKEANTKADQRVINAELRAAATKAGMVDLDGLKLADTSSLKLNEKGEVEGVEALMKSLKEAKPYLFTTNNNTSGSGKKPEPTGGAGSVKDMTPAEYAAARSAAIKGARK